MIQMPSMYPALPVLLLGSPSYKLFALVLYRLMWAFTGIWNQRNMGTTYCNVSSHHVSPPALRAGLVHIMPAKKGTPVPEDLSGLQFQMVIAELMDGKSLHNLVLRAVQNSVVAV